MGATPEETKTAEAQIAKQAKRIEFYLTEYSVELLANKMKSGDFQIPEYQREDVWEPDRKSRFIESLIMGLPIPFLFFWERPDGNLEVVDGSQRLRTIQAFILGGFKLGTLVTLDKLSDFRLEDLPESRQKKIKNRSIRGIVLNEHADEQARFELFDRINTGSKIANKAEVRRGANPGPFMDLVISLAKHDLFVQLAPLSKAKFEGRVREDLVTRFFAYSDGLEGYKDRPADFLFKYAAATNRRFAADPPAQAAYRERFVSTLAFVSRAFPYGFRRSPRGESTPHSRFEAIAVGSFFALSRRPQLADSPPDTSGWLTSDEFNATVRSDSANVVKKLRHRIDYVRNKLLEPA